MGSINTDRDGKERRKRTLRRWFWRGLLLIVGVLAVGAMIRQLGWAQIAQTVVTTAPWLPLICALDLLWVAVEGGAVLSVYGSERKAISARNWLFITLVHYATFMLFPLGRAAAEITRATLVRKHVDRYRASVGVALMQSFTLLTNGLVCGVAAACVALLPHSRILLGALTFNGVLLFGMGVASYVVLRRVNMGGWFAKRFTKLTEIGPAFDAEFRASQPHHKWAVVFCMCGRSIQALQYGVIVFAVSGQFSFSSAWIAEGIQVVARSAGDFIPNQVGVTEGAFVFFREALGLAALPAVAMSIALVARISNVIMATACIVLAQLWPASKGLHIVSEPTQDVV